MVGLAEADKFDAKFQELTGSSQTAPFVVISEVIIDDVVCGDVRDKFCAFVVLPECDGRGGGRDCAVRVDGDGLVWCFIFSVGAYDVELLLLGYADSEPSARESEPEEDATRGTGSSRCGPLCDWRLTRPWYSMKKKPMPVKTNATRWSLA